MPDDPANIEALQELKATEGAQAVKEQGIRQLLQLLDPHPNDAKLSYANVLARLQTVMLREMQAATAMEPTPPATPAMPPAAHAEPASDSDTEPDTDEETSHAPA